MSNKVTISQAEYESLVAVYKAASHFVGMSAGVKTGDPKIWRELGRRQEARDKLEDAVENAAKYR